MDLNELTFVDKTVFYDVTGSTNDDAWRLSNDPKIKFAVISADFQTNGRGRMQRKWESLKGQNIMASILIRSSVQSIYIPQITILMASCIRKVLSRLFNIDFKIKWPNDIIFEGKKICGILTESRTKGKESAIVIGFGINCNQDSFPKDIVKKAVSIRQIIKAKVDRHKILNEIVKEFYLEYTEFSETHLKGIIPYVKKNIAWMNEEICVVIDSKITPCKMTDIDEDGSLIVDLKDGRRRKIISGEILNRK